MATVRSATVADVARLAGVSTATVSRALSRPELVTDRTRRRIAVAIRHLGYEPMEAAQRLGSRRHGRLGVLVGAKADQEARELASSCVRAVAVRGRSAALHPVPQQGEARATYLEHLSRAHTLDGLIDLGACLSADEARAAGQATSTVVAAAGHPLLGVMPGRRAGSLLPVRTADLVVAVGAAGGSAAGRLAGLSEVVPRIVADWHDGTLAGAFRTFAGQLATRRGRGRDARVAYVALDAVAAGGGALALAGRSRSTPPLVCIVSHPLTDVHRAITVRIPHDAVALTLVDELLERIDRAAPPPATTGRPA
jgi:DNA-binding LacI/PurR family transcriptional regulator